jgi:hypothetical protein
MKKKLFFILFLLSKLDGISQNVGIGTATPLNGRLVIRGTVGAVSALFGDNSTGVAIENSFPGIGLNTYYNGSRKFIANGYGGLIGLDPNNGDMYIMNTASAGVADANAAIISRLFINGASGNVGIGTTSTPGKLTVNATSSTNGIYAYSTTAGNVMRAESFGPGSSSIAVNAYSINGYGLFGSSGPTGYALFTSGRSLLSSPVLINNPASSANAGAIINSTALDYGIYSYANDAATVIRAENSSNGTAIQAFSGGAGIGLQADGTNPLAYAIYANGRVHVQGTLSKTAGSFKIDHPQDPENKFLIHSFVESPDMMNVYNGNITTDGNGLAVVTLPSYFEASNIDFKYQLTVVGKEFASALIYEEIKNNKFVIKTDKPAIKISWQVTGVRNDAYAQKNRIVAEVDKNELEKGKYLAPELFNQPQEKRIGYSKK